MFVLISLKKKLYDLLYLYYQTNGYWASKYGSLLFIVLSIYSETSKSKIIGIVGDSKLMSMQKYNFI